MTPHAPASAPPAAGRQARFTSAGASLVALVAASLVASCSLTVDGFIEGCQTDADCAGKGGEFASSTCREGACRAPDAPAKGNDWSCLDRAGVEPVEPPEYVRVNLRFVDLMSAQPIAGVSLLVCSNTDVTCEQPLAPAALSDGGGQIEAQVQTATAIGGPGFGGYFQAIAPEHESTLFFFHPPLLADTEEVVAVGPPRQISSIAPALGFTADPERTAAVLLARDCRNDPSPDVIFEFEASDPELRLFYGINSIPSATAAHTDRSGTAFAMNAPQGVLSFRMIHPSRGVLARFLVNSRRDFLSVAAIRPAR